MNTHREFTELLKGTRPIKDDNGDIIVQSILNMSIVCLTTDDEYSLDDRFSNPLKSLAVSNSGYGEMTFKNTGNKETITPAQIAVITSQRAQNHGMVKSGYISGNNTVKFNDAGCVQGSTTGYFKSSQEFRMIPVTMREMLFDKIGETSGYQNVYSAITKLGEDTNSNAGQYLDKYFNKYDKKLEEFIAHFERPEKTIGVIVFIDDEIVAIDKYPSFTYTEQVWDLLIRDCYGALAIISELKDSKSNNLFTDKLNSLRSYSNESTLDRLERVLNETKKAINDNVEDKIQDLFDLTLEAQLDNVGNSVGNGPKSYVLKHEGYIGQVISESEYHHMVSIVKKERFNPSALRIISEMRKKAKSQEKFQL